MTTLTPVENLIKAAQAVIDRLDSPNWKDTTHTADYIHALREAVNSVTPIEPLPQNKMEILHFNDCMTVAQLKAYIANWPETAENGEPCEVWIGDVNGYTNCVKEASPLNFRYSDDKSTCWSDLILFA
jgi:hypothetical protein